MGNNLKIVLLLLTLSTTFWSCQKNDLPLDAGVVKERQVALESDIKKMLQDAEYGFILYPESATTNTVVKAAANFTMKFDTVKNQVTMSSGLASYAGPSMSYYTLSAATGMPLLNFSTSSFISRIYATGDAGITDFFFRVMRLTGDTIKVQPYRKGNIYASEGGPVFNMLKIKPSIDIPGRSAFDTVKVLLPVGTTTTRSVKFGSALNIAAYTSDVNAEITTDPSLVEVYNVKNNTQYKVFPAGAYELVKNKTIIPRDAKYSSDSFEVSIKNPAAFVSGSDYILPVKTVVPNSFSAGLKSTVFVILQLNNVDASNAGLTGTALSKTAWTATASTINGASFVAANAIDGNNNTSWINGGDMPTMLTLNMGSVNTVNGFTFFPYNGAQYVPLEVEIYSSPNGTTWNFQGTYSSTSTTIAIKTMKFISPVSSQYFRFRIMKATNASLSGFAELTAY